ncbi:MAG: Uma2 family endonuclease [Gammaproteobacteria bacterium]|nr:MAG: Uma2 family endonuclease [Gammaproteobacteria bacterium]
MPSLKVSKENLLKSLIYEYRNGKPIYYKNYKKVLEGAISKEEVMGSSSLHALLVMLIGAYLKSVLGKRFLVLGGELGYIPKRGTRYNLDLAVFEREKLQKEGIRDSYVKTPPKVVIEIDPKIEPEKFGSEDNYILAKTQDLLDSGVETVIWFLTRERKVLFAQRGKDWLISNWERDLKITEEVTLNIEKLLKEEGITLDTYKVASKNPTPKGRGF